ncbi:lytic transglycosylase domain-containing protein [Tepidimonas ignava]|uniref:lytic transglycosylase domain-containing protein n=1 Tax=Tepidimonas ignava TaxID=114249 RepID=UPI002FD87E8A
MAGCWVRSILTACRAALVGVVGAVWLVAHANPAHDDAVRQALLATRDAAARGDVNQLSALRPRVRGDLTEPLADYWWMRAQLDRAGADDVRAVLQRWSGTYWEDRLRNDWLRVLGARADWDTLLTEAGAYRMNDDAEVRCYVALARLERGLAPAQELAPVVQQAWLAQRNAEPGCAQAAGRLIAIGALPAEVAWQRARLGVEAGRLAVATQAVALLEPAWVPLVQQAYNQPQRYLDDKVTAVRQRTKEVVTLALIRLASLDPQAAADEAQHLRWRAQLTPQERGWVWGAIGRRAALRLDGQALSYFERTWEVELPAEWRAWHVRAALRGQAWPVVLRAIERLPAVRQDEAVWTYWRARALQATGQPEQARALLQRVAGPEGFYEQLALEALGQPVTLPGTPPPPTADEAAAVRANSGLQRALRLIEWGLRNEGVREWHYEVALHTPGGLPERLLLAAAAWACERAVWDRCINTSSRTRQQVDVAQRYPMPLRDLVEPRAQTVGLDPAYVYGLIRQESRFVTDARSVVGASGLMQVMPATARWTARKIGLQGFEPQHLHDPSTNVTIGTAYLKLALDEFEGSIPLAAAAYNAGPGRARQWRQGPVLPAPIWIENIPFDETRDYVQRVVANTVVYAARLTGQPQRPSERLAPIGPRLTTARGFDPSMP